MNHYQYEDTRQQALRERDPGLKPANAELDHRFTGRGKAYVVGIRVATTPETVCEVPILCTEHGVPPPSLVIKAAQVICQHNARVHIARMGRGDDV